MILTSCFNRVVNYFSGAQATETTESSGTDTRVKRASRCSFSKIGIFSLLAGAGLANIARLYNPNFDSDTPHFSFFNDGMFAFVERPNCKKFIDLAREYLESCPYAKEILERKSTKMLCKSGPLNLFSRFDPSSDSIIFSLPSESYIITIREHVAYALRATRQSELLESTPNLDNELCSMTADENIELRSSILRELFEDSLKREFACIEEGYWPRHFYSRDHYYRREFANSEHPINKFQRPQHPKDLLRDLLENLPEENADRISNLIDYDLEQAIELFIEYHIENEKAKKMKSIDDEIDKAKEQFRQEWQENCLNFA